jgi:hypothetical protein
MPWSITFDSVWKTLVMIVGPPGVPATMNSLPSRSSTTVGVIADSMRFPGSIAFRSPWTSPYWFGVPGRDVKSSISLLSTNPAPATVTLLPYHEFSVVVIATALPKRSTIETCVVCIPSCEPATWAASASPENSSTPGRTASAGVARSVIDAARIAA